MPFKTAAFIGFENNHLILFRDKKSPKNQQDEPSRKPQESKKKNKGEKVFKNSFMSPTLTVFRFALFNDWKTVKPEWNGCSGKMIVNIAFFRADMAGNWFYQSSFKKELLHVMNIHIKLCEKRREKKLESKISITREQL